MERKRRSDEGAHLEFGKEVADLNAEGICYIAYRVEPDAFRPVFDFHDVRMGRRTYHVSEPALRDTLPLTLSPNGLT